MLPLIFLFIFTGLFGGDTIEEYGGIEVSTYYVPGIITLAVVVGDACRASPSTSPRRARAAG